MLSLIAALVLAQSVPDGFIVESYGAGISLGTSMAWLPDGRLLVCEQGGGVRVLKSGILLGPRFHTVAAHLNAEQGLLGIAVDPDFAVNGYVYLYFTNPSGGLHNCIRRVTANPPSSDVSTGAETPILDLEALGIRDYHNGGTMQFGPDGKLYLAVGENGTRTLAQSLTSRFGKLLRYNADGSIPGDNPTSFGGLGGPTSGIYRAIWAVGFRNPFSFAFQPGTGRMFVNDVGELTWEEVNEGIAGSNYGWPPTEGDFNALNFPGYRAPLHTYVHTQGAAITGSAFYNPPVPQFPPEYLGRYFFADFVHGWIRWLDPAAPGTASPFLSGASGVVSLQIGPDGFLYYLTRGGGSPGVRRVRFTGGVLQGLTVSDAALSVNEGSSTTFTVKPVLDPAGTLVVDVAHLIGSPSVLALPSTLTFTSADWTVPQTVTVTAALDADSVDNGATILVASGALAPATVVVTASDTNPAPVADSPLSRISLPLNGAVVGGALAEFFGDGTPVAPATMVQAQFFIDGVLASTDANVAGHYHIHGSHASWNTTLLSDGPHVLRMTVTDSTGKTGSHEVTVTVFNPPEDDEKDGCGGTGMEGFLAGAFLLLLRRMRRAS